MRLSGAFLLVVIATGCVSSASGGGVRSEEPNCLDTIERDIGLAPRFTPYHEGPRLIDADHFLVQLRSNLMAAVDEGAESLPVKGWLLISDRGCVARVVIEHPTASAALDSVLEAQWLGTEWTRPLLRYGADQGRERAVAVWIQTDLVGHSSSGDHREE